MKKQTAAHTHCEHNHCRCATCQHTETALGATEGGAPCGQRGETPNVGQDADGSGGSDGEEAHRQCCAHSHTEEHSHGGKGRATDCGCGAEPSPMRMRTQIIWLSVGLVGLILSFIDIWSLVGLPFLHYIDLAWIAVVFSGWPILKSAALSLKNKKLSANVLISVAIFASIALQIVLYLNPALGGGDGHGESYIFVAGEIAFLMAIGELIEDYTVQKSRSGIERLVTLTPKSALLLDADGGVNSIPAEQIKVSDTVLVKPNSAISVDGVVTKGETAIDQSAITGESLGVDARVGTQVFAGTFNQYGAIEVRATKASGDSSISRLVALALEAEEKKAPIARVADKWASVIVPAAAIICVAVVLLAKFVLAQSLIGSIVRGVTILVVFCPCALALATPTAIAAGIGKASFRGILIKSGSALEALAHTDTFAFDKTGTLTQGKITVKNIVALPPFDAPQILALAAAAESHSEHPIASSVLDYAKAQAVTYRAPASTRSLVGIGVEAVTEDGRTVLVSSYGAALKNGLSQNLLIKAAESELLEGCTVVVVSVDSAAVGILSLSDTLRPDAKKAVSALHGLGISTVMLTGDNASSAGAIAASVGIQSVQASLMPADKLEKINALKADGHVVCMLGDGVNDAPALAAADASIAFAELGSDIAVDRADVALINSDIKQLPSLVRLSRRVYATIVLNIVLSLTISVASVILSTFGLLTPLTGALVHNASSILVVLCSALILKANIDKQTKKQKLRESLSAATPSAE